MKTCLGPHHTLTNKKIMPVEKLSRKYLVINSLRGNLKGL